MEIQLGSYRIDLHAVATQHLQSLAVCLGLIPSDLSFEAQLHRSRRSGLRDMSERSSSEKSHRHLQQS